MEAKEQIINDIIQMEWKMFQTTKNIGGRADCQENWPQFELNRRSQFSVWNLETIFCYYQDLKSAEKNEENLVAYKYGYMMLDTDPEAYETIKDLLPKIDEGKKQMIDNLLSILINWCDEFAEKYPCLYQMGRPVRQTSEMNLTSVEVYARGEMSTYSKNTLNNLLRFYRYSRKTGQNLYEKTLELELGVVYGIPLELLEKKLSERRL